MHIMQAGDDMASKLMIAGIPLLISLGGLIFTLEATAQESEEVEERVRVLEVKQAESSSTKVMVSQNTERMARLEAVVMENAKQLNKLSQDMAAVCQATGARCR